MLLSSEFSFLTTIGLLPPELIIEFRLFSFAYSILSVITGYTKLNELNVNLAGCQYKIINKSHANLEKLDEYVTSDFMESLVGEIIRIDNIKKKILNPLPNSDIKIIFRSMLKIYINERMNFSDCYKKILIFRHDQFSSYKKTNKSICINPELNKIFMQFSELFSKIEAKHYEYT